MGIHIVRIEYATPTRWVTLFERRTPDPRRHQRHLAAARRLVAWLRRPERPWFGEVGFCCIEAWAPGREA